MSDQALAGVALAIQSAIVLYLVIGEPLYGKRAYQRLLATLGQDPFARVRFYRKIIILEWALVFLVLLTLRMAGEPMASIGLGAPRFDSQSLVLLIALLMGIAAPLVLGAVSPGYRKGLQQQTEPLRGMLPERRDERWWFALVSVTAGVCEEILFRGFLIAYLTTLVPGLPDVGALLITGVIFGMAHLYQGWTGVVTTGVLGVVLGLFYFYTGSLLWPIVAHALLDLRVLALPLQPPKSQA